MSYAQITFGSMGLEEQLRRAKLPPVHERYIHKLITKDGYEFVDYRPGQNGCALILAGQARITLDAQGCLMGLEAPQHSLLSIDEKLAIQMAVLPHSSSMAEDLATYRTALSLANAKADTLRTALLGCASIFEEYAAKHEAKGTDDGRVKAQANQMHAAEIRALLEMLDVC